MPDYSPLHRGRSRVAVASGPVLAGQLVRISGTAGIYPTVFPTSGATGDWFGVAAFDAPSGAVVTVECEGEQIIRSAGPITAGSNVEGAASGTVASHTNGTSDVNIVGVATSTVATAAQSVTVLMLR